MDPSLDLIGTPSPPISPQRRTDGSAANTPTQAARNGRRLKRLSLASGAVFNTTTDPVEANVKDAMQDNPSFASPSRPAFNNDDETIVTASASPALKPPLIIEETPSTPTTTTKHQATPRTRPRGTSQSTTDGTVRPRTPGYRSSIYGNIAAQSKTPQMRRARKSSSRERMTLEPAFQEGNGKDTARSSLDSAFSRSPAAQLAPRPTSLPSPGPPNIESTTRRPNGPLTLIEKHADLLAYIAQKEAEVNDARKVYERKLQELDEVKKRWEAITARQGFHSTTTPSSSSLSIKGHQAPLPIRRTASNSSTGSTGSVGPQNGVLPLVLPHGSAASEVAVPSSLGGSVHSGQNASSVMVEGSRRLFGHLLESLSDLTTTTTTEDAPGAEIGTPSGGEGDEKKREKREMRTLSLIAGVGTTAKHAKNGNAAVGDRHTRGTTSPTRRRTSVVSTSSERSSEVISDRMAEPPDQPRVPFEASANAVDFANMFDGLAPQARDWKEKLGSVMGVSAPTIQSSQKKASEFLTSNLTHTLDFFSQALPTPNLNASTHVDRSASENGSKTTVKQTRLQRRPLTDRAASDRSQTAEESRSKFAPDDQTDLPWNW